MTMHKHPHVPIRPESDLHPEMENGHGVDRRAFLKLLAASAALASAGCSGPPQEKIVPYVQMPELMTPGLPLYYASAFVRRGIAQGVLIESNMGRPTKIEGNPRHPASLGATDIFAQASVLQLWDPDRSKAVWQRQMLSTWQSFEAALQAQREAWDADGGAGLRILTGTITSPTLVGQIDGLLKRYPNARWHCYDPLHDDAAHEGMLQAFGRPLDAIYLTGKAAVMLTVDADLFGDEPGAVRYARDFTANRPGRNGNAAGVPSNRLYAIEATPTLTGAYADHRLALAPHDIERTIWRIAARIGVPGAPGDVPPAVNAEAQKWEAAVAKQLLAHRGASLVAAAGSVSANTRALVHRINEHLGNVGKTVLFIPRVEAGPQNHADSIAVLARAMRGGAVKSLFIFDANPAYDAPADLQFSQAMEKVPFSVHLGLYRDETARRAVWHLPQSHLYEQWSDARAWDGTASIVQPAIAPLYDGRSAHELLALMTRDGERNGHAIVRRYWQEKSRADDFEMFWETALREGAVKDSASAPVNAKARGRLVPPLFSGPPLRALFVADQSTGAGEFANNAWLQELPKSFTKITWGNAALVSEDDAKAAGIETGDVLRLRQADRPDVSVDAPAWVLPNQPAGVVTLSLGHGRRSAGGVGEGVGFDAYPLRTLSAMRGISRLVVEKTGRRHVFATTQNHARMEGRDLARFATLDEYRRNPHFATEKPLDRPPDVTLYPEWKYDGYKWGMAVDLNACIGCNACTIACQAENNIPSVGREEVIRGREMHWIRVDRDYVGDAKRPRTMFQPVPCMHCEKAPCEEVCPVGATVHDSEGLNVQVYNRCVGTRFCSNNCPYKVRRFNFLQYSNNEVESIKAVQNPEVTVRHRGVMEKCTYCLQRITRARTEAEKLGRRLQDGEVVTACQAVCPTQAIVFGDLNDPKSGVNRAKASPLDYALLVELNTQPRTSYGAKVINEDEDLV